MTNVEAAADSMSPTATPDCAAKDVEAAVGVDRIFLNGNVDCVNVRLDPSLFVPSFFFAP